MDKKNKLTQIIEIVQKDKSQFEILYSQVISKVYFWCYSIVGDKTIAEDLAQESMLKIYQNIDKLDHSEAFSSWAYILVRNICYDFLRSNKKIDFQSLESNDYSTGFENIVKEERIENLPEEALDAKEVKSLMMSFIEKLPRKQKEVIILFYLEEFTTTEIANMLDANVGSIRSCLRFGRQNLEKKINRYQDKHNLRLYSTILLPLLGIILQEQQDNIGYTIDLKYDSSLFHETNISKITNGIRGLSTNMLSLVSISLAVTVVSITALFSSIAYNKASEHKTLDSLLDTSDMFNKTASNKYIESITYNTFPTRNSASVKVNLKKDLTDESIMILLDEEEIPFRKIDKELHFTVPKNGEYKVNINSIKLTVNITTIDEYAPEVVGIQNELDYLQLIINDEKSQINYDKSYLDYLGKQYPITLNNQVIGTFKGQVIIYIYNDSNQYAYYEFNLE